MIKAEINKSEISVLIDTTMVVDYNEKGVIRYEIEVEDNTRPQSEPDNFNTNYFAFDVMGTEALIQLSDALKAYIDTTRLRDLVKVDSE